MSLIYINGAETGVVVQDSLGSFFHSVNGGVNIDGIVKRGLGNYSLNFTSTTLTSAYASWTLPAGLTTLVHRLYFIVPSGGFSSSTNMSILTVKTTTNTTAEIQFRYNASNGKVGWQVSSETAVERSTTIVADTWYRLDARINVSGSTWTVDWAINDVAQTQLTSTKAADTFSVSEWGIKAKIPGIVNIDDIAVANTTTDYPIGPGSIVLLKPNAMGTNVGATNFSTESGAISSTSYQSIDDVPIDNASDYIQQDTVSSSSYIEFDFEDPGTSNIHGVKAVLVYHSTGAGANNAKAQLIYGTSVVNPGQNMLLGIPFVPVFSEFDDSTSNANLNSDSRTSQRTAVSQEYAHVHNTDYNILLMGSDNKGSSATTLASKLIALNSDKQVGI